MLPALDIDTWELSRTHWAIKDIDLFGVLIRDQSFVRPKPSIFNIATSDVSEHDLVSLMMPFDPRFDAVHTTIRQTVETLGMRCQRADDIWNHDVVIQDIVSLIDRSRIVICDCTGKNPNVFYEAGIAHALGRNVILITQSADDIPFDLRHLRFVSYLNNSEGLVNLSDRLSMRLKVLS